MSVSRCLVAALLALPGLVWAQSLPKPAEFYFEADANTVRPVVAIRGESEAVLKRLLKAVERDSGARAEAAQLGRIAMQGGRVDAGKGFYARALAGLEPSHMLWRPVTWNYAWDLYRAGEPAAALERWSSLVLVRGTTGSWVPPTLALGLWRAGRRQEAVQWYAAAMRTEPRQWDSPAHFARLLPGWRDDERAVLAEVHAAWRASPPSWP